MKKYLILSPLMLSFVMLLFFAEAHMEIVSEKISQKMGSIVNEVDLIALQVNSMAEQDGDWGLYDYESFLKEATRSIDVQPRVFAALYNEELSLVSEREIDPGVTPFDPFAYPDFRNLISSGVEKTNAHVPVHENKSNYEMHLYSRWVPHGEYMGKYLIVVGISKNSIDSKFASWITWGAIGVLAATITSQVWLVILVSKTADREEELRRQASAK